MILAARKVSKSYQQGQKSIAVLSDLNLEVNPGEIISILGKSGSGKSTLLSTLCGLEPVDSGQVIIGERDLHSLPESEKTKFRSEHIGVIFQHYHLVPHLTALENIILPIEIKGGFSGHDLEVAKSILKEVGLEHRANHKPSELSGGEKQRVAIARAIVTKPTILLADEPSGSLDNETGQHIMEMLFSVVKKHQLAMILVTHDETLARRTDRKLVLDRGQLGA